MVKHSNRLSINNKKNLLWHLKPLNIKCIGNLVIQILLTLTVKIHLKIVSLEATLNKIWLWFIYSLFSRCIPLILLFHVENNMVIWEESVCSTGSVCFKLCGWYLIHCVNIWICYFQKAVFPQYNRHYRCYSSYCLLYCRHGLCYTSRY